MTNRTKMCFLRDVVCEERCTAYTGIPHFCLLLEGVRALKYILTVPQTKYPPSAPPPEVR